MNRTLMNQALRPLLALLPLAGCMGDNRSLESVHPPIVENGHARVDGCPDWSSQDKQSATATMSNYGCASNSNLAAMIADPEDLVRGRSAPTTTDSAVRAVKVWRDGRQGAK